VDGAEPERILLYRNLASATLISEKKGGGREPK